MYFEADIGVEELVSRISELEAIGGSAIAHVKYKAGGHFISVLGAVKKANNSLPYLIVNDPDTDAASKPCSENWELAMRGNFRNGAHLHLLYAVAPQVPTKEIPYIFGKSQAIAVENAIKNLLSDSEKNAESIRQILERTEPGIIEKSNVLKNAKDSFFDKKEEKMQK